MATPATENEQGDGRRDPAMRALWFFIRLFIILAISLSIAGLQGSVLVYAYGYEIHIRLWVTLVFMVLFVLAVWYILRGLGWIHAGVAYITRTRKLYKQLAAIPHIAAGRAYATVKSSVLKPFGKKHPLYQITSYQVNTAYDIHIPTVLSSPYAAQFIQACISHNDTRQLSAVRAFYTTRSSMEIIITVITNKSKNNKANNNNVKIIKGRGGWEKTLKHSKNRSRRPKH